MWQLKLFPISIVNMGIIMLIWIILTPVEGMLRDISFPLPLKGFLICLIGVLIVHELIHAALHPMVGCSPRSIIGFWPSRMFLYTTYDGDITRNRYLAIFTYAIYCDQHHSNFHCCDRPNSQCMGSLYYHPECLSGWR